MTSQQKRQAAKDAEIAALFEKKTLAQLLAMKYPRNKFKVNLPVLEAE